MLMALPHAGLAQLADTFVSDPRRHFAEGQSVRAAVAAVDAARGRFALSLKPSLVAAPDGAYLGSLFRDLEAAERMRCAPCAACCGPAHGCDASCYASLPVDFGLFGCWASMGVILHNSSTFKKCKMRVVCMVIRGARGGGPAGCISGLGCAYASGPDGKPGRVFFLCALIAHGWLGLTSGSSGRPPRGPPQ